MRTYEIKKTYVRTYEKRNYKKFKLKDIKKS